MKVVVGKESHIDKDGYYFIKDYDKKQPFASFLSAIAGVEGIPMWSFYVNRGQVISSIGIQDKSNSIMEFFPANEAYKMVYTNGFRTFIKIIKENNKVIYEPFAINESECITRELKIKNNELELLEVNNEVGITTKVKYFTVPNDTYAAMARKVEIINNSNEEIKVEILDGIATILPYGSDYLAYKQMSNLLRSWMEAKALNCGAVEYKVRTSTADTTEVEEVKNSYFYLAIDENDNKLKTIVDFENVFGYDTSLKSPMEFNKKSLEELYVDGLESFNKVPCAFSGKEGLLMANESTSIYSYIGFVKNNEATEEIVNRICNKEYFYEKENQTNILIDEIVKHVETKTAYPMFDEYIKQCYVDNVLRGGYPLEIGKNNKKTYYVYSRKHGDLERDYNFFNIEANYYSQGNGNFRDINQNRRMDIFIHPFIGVENIKLFMNLIQLDGYNPLVIKGKKFNITNKEKINKILELFSESDKKSISSLLDNEFTLGELYSKVKEVKNIEFDVKSMLLDTIIDEASDNVDAEFGEGFWIDHWTYNLDLVEEYINMYPDNINELLLEDDTYKFYNSPEYVLPRKERFVLNKVGEVRQYKSLDKKKNNEKWVLDKNGNLYKTNLITKLFMLASIKFMSLDPYGIGIEMEAGKPGWNDAMNGLPGLIGSSTAETFELKRLLNFLDKYSDIINQLELPIEFHKMLLSTNKVLSLQLTEQEYWEAICDIKEEYRAAINDGVDGKRIAFNNNEIKVFINSMLSKVNKGIEKLNSLEKSIVPTFLYYNVEEYTTLEEDNNKYILPKKFKLKHLPEFLEGPARYLKTGLGVEKAREIYNNIKASEIYDRNLKMYKTSAPLDDVTFEIGRARGFAAGWLERESIFMHMEYKYILGLLKAGLYEEFFEEIKNILPPFMNEDVYGRSILENSSFIASSVNPDKRTHGRGFVARLTGTTVEMLNMWKLMMVGNTLFSYENEVLNFKLNPILSKDFFDENNKVTTVILGNTKIIYNNPNRKDTFGTFGGIISKITLVDLKGNEVEIQGCTITGELALDIRNGNIKEIIVEIS